MEQRKSLSRLKKKKNTQNYCKEKFLRDREWRRNKEGVDWTNRLIKYTCLPG